MTARSLLTLALLLSAAASPTPPVSAAEPAREMHGSADAFAADGVALAWAILRGVNEADTVAVVQVVADAAAFPVMTAAGSDPFSARVKSLVVTTPTPGRFALRVARVHFAEFPRTDFKFYGTTPATPSDTPTLVVFYLGVPDTTPEFSSEAALDSYLADRLARVNRAPQGKPR